MPRNWSKAVPEGNGPVPQREEFRPDQPTLADVYRLFEERLDRHLNLIKSHFDQQDKKLNELMAKTKETKHRSAGLEQEARQPSLATEADAPTDTKTRNRTEGAAAAERVISGDNSSTEVIPTRSVWPASVRLHRTSSSFLYKV